MCVCVAKRDGFSFMLEVKGKGKGGKGERERKGKERKECCGDGGIWGGEKERKEGRKFRGKRRGDKK